MSTAVAHAERMPGIPRTEDGFDMPRASWWRVTPPAHDERGPSDHVVVTNHGVYPCDSGGQLSGWRRCLYPRPAVGTPEQALAAIGYPEVTS